MRTPLALLLALAAALLLRVSQTNANNIQVANINLVDNGGGMATVQFDISWENSWRGGGVNNWDAAWVFVKYKLPGDGGLSHMYLDPADQQYPSGATIDQGLLVPASTYDPVTNPLVGVFIRRDADGTGTLSASGAQVKWNYGSLGLSFGDIAEVRVYAIEMVYINQGAFYLGSGGDEHQCFHAGSAGIGTPYRVTSSAQIPMGDAAGSLWAGGAIQTGTIPAAFPKGFNASYAMKYEISQQQYVDFLNSLTRQQQAQRVATAIPLSTTIVGAPYVMTATAALTDRQAIRCDATIDALGSVHFYCDANGNGIGGETDDGQWIACNYLSWGDVSAYLDWSGLRPMSELEFEKICRGTLPSLAWEFPWRTATIASTAYGLGDASAANEGIATGYSTTAGNAAYTATTNGEPVRVGAFASHASSTGRITAGAGYYGAMELAGNQAEFAVSIADFAGRGYTGVHGNGELTATGGHNCANWPPQENASGLGTRGGHNDSPNTEFLTTSNRSNAGSTSDTRSNGSGGRGVRTAP